MSSNNTFGSSSSETVARANRNVRDSRPRPHGRFQPLLSATLSVLLPLSTTFMLWKTLCILTNSSIPIVCVVSNSMAPAFHRGDILFLWNRTAAIEAGDIPVVWFDGAPLPMVHRVVQVFSGDLRSGKDDFLTAQHFLTKGDNNALNDIALYPQHRTSVLREEVMGFTRGYIPFMGWLVIISQEIYWLRYLALLFLTIIIIMG